MYMRLLRHVVRRSAFCQLYRYSTSSYRTKTSKPLRILFCGSDDFSIGSLRALHEEQKRDPQLIQSIDVLCRPGKVVGRAMKTIRDGC
jgi:methionyl-tRNA formyltransferase